MSVIREKNISASQNQAKKESQTNAVKQKKLFSKIKNYLYIHSISTKTIY